MSGSKVKMTDVAKAAGVSAMTVSRALKHDGRIAPVTRRKILAVVEQLGYRPDRLAGSFSSQRSGFVSVLVPSLNNPHFAETAAGLQDALSAKGLQLLLGHTNYSPTQTELMIETMLERRPEAMIITYDGYTKRARQALVSSGIPVIEIWERPRDAIAHVVGFSNHAAGKAMTQHLIDIGRRRIGYIGERGDSGTRGAARRKGFLQAMAAAGLDPHRQIAQVAPPIGMIDGRAAMVTLLEQFKDIDAVMCVSDPAAFGAITAAQLLGRNVPDDIAIAGFGDFEVSRACLPTISTVAVHGTEIGARAGTLIIDLLHGDQKAKQFIEIAAVPVVRESTSRTR